jgi:hypothetical protein
MPKSRRTVNDRKALAALIGVFALMLQALVPAAAMAARSGPDGAVVICTAEGTQTVSADGRSAGAPASHKRFGGMPCQDCLAAAMAALAPAPAVIEPVAYQTARADLTTSARPLAPRARAPPRPPGQGPPAA